MRAREAKALVTSGPDIFWHPSAGELIEKTRESWKFIRGLPVPRFHIQCPVCRTYNVQYSRLQFFQRKGSTHIYRADVRFKCRECAATWIHGVAVPEEEYPRDGNKVAWTGKQVAKEIKRGEQD